MQYDIAWRNKEYEGFEYAMSTVGKSTDDYLFLYDFERDYYSIAEGILKKFNLPGAQFNNVLDVLRTVIHPDDFALVCDDFTAIKNGRKDEHDLKYRWIDKNGDALWLSCRGQAILDEDGYCKMLVGRISELGSKNKADNLTGFLTEPQLNMDFHKVKNENKGFSGFMMKIGVNNFKQINEKYGMDVGDMVLKAIAQCFVKVVPKGINIYRVGSKTFILFAHSGEDLEMAKAMYAEIFNEIDASIVNYNYKIFYSISAGVVEIPAQSLDYNTLQRKAEFALNAAIREERESFFIFEDVAYEQYMRRIEIQEVLRVAVNNHFEGFRINYQPIVESDTHKIIGAEALLRFRCEAFGNLTPYEFIPILEESGLIIPVGRWVINESLKQCKIWQQIIKGFHMSINLSYIQIKRCDVLYEVMNCLEKYDMTADSIVLELTESGHIENDKSILEKLERIRANEVMLAIDDFGTGYSNLTYLKDFNVNILKIDRTFIGKALNSDYYYKLVSHIIDMAHSIDLRVCVEGIETFTEASRVAALGPDLFQGFLFGKPMETEDFARLIS